MIRFSMIALLATAPAIAQASTQRSRDSFGSLYASKWVDTSLPAFPVNLVTGNLRFRKPYFIAAGVNRVLVRNFAVGVPLTGIVLRGNSLELEGQLVKHFGGQDHVEATIALPARSGEIGLFSGASVNFALANGVSYALSRPDFEQGPGGVRGQGSRHLQYYLGLEAEFSPSRASRLHLVAKLHHRSGIYGLISPRRTGSNFLGAGVRFDF